MGNSESYNLYLEQTKPDFIPESDCLICLDSIAPRTWTQCHRCHIYLHNICEETYRGNRGYCKCPHCQQIGTLGSFRYN
jgi:hypothetical protein